jgi:hypothetical protein
VDAGASHSRTWPEGCGGTRSGGAVPWSLALLPTFPDVPITAIVPDGFLHPCFILFP